MGAYYITMDLDLKARVDLTLLDAELRQAGLHGGANSHNGKCWASYSSSKCCSRHPAETIDHFLGIVDGLSSEARDLWNRCSSRRFDLGFQGCDERFCSRWRLKAPLLRRLADVGGDLIVTIYKDDGTKRLG